MDCNIIRDLLPLYVDDCCSEESKKNVEAHLENCPECRKIHEAMLIPADISNATPAVIVPKKISEWKASVLQSILLFISFGLITFGVAKEASTPTGFMNGYWAYMLVIPATGFMLSLANWYFVRVYKSRRLFSNCSCLITFAITLGAYVWSFFHYEVDLSTASATFFEGLLVNESIGELIFYVLFYCAGTVLTVVFCILSKLLSSKYAEMLGKE